MAKYLGRRGDRVTVLTTSIHGRDDDEGHSGAVVRAADMRQLRRWLAGRTAGRRGDGVGDVRGDGAPAAASAASQRVVALWVPDRMAVTWVPFALRAALALHHRHSFDAVVTTSPPESAHLIGRALAWRGCPWVADLRDGWTFEAWRQFPTRLQRRIDQRLERHTLEAADAVTCVTAPVGNDLRRRTKVDPLLVPHGFDPELVAAAWERRRDAAEARLDPNRVSIVYTGRLGAVGRDLDPLRQALRELAAEEGELAERLELAIAGPVREEERELFDMDLSPLRVSSLGPLPHGDALALQRAADVLLIIGSRRAHVANLKLYEYIGSGTPMLAIAPGGEAGRIVAEAGGEVVPADTEAIRGALRRAAARGLPAPGEAIPSRFAYPAPAERMSEAIDLAIERSAAGAKRDPVGGQVGPAAEGDRRTPLRVRRLDSNPVISPSMLPGRDGANINGPSLIRAPEWLGMTLGRYWLYFAHHHGDYIRVAHADDIEGPWRVHHEGSLRLDQVPGACGHIASPDVHVDEGEARIRMYFHAPTPAGPQRTFVATSADGLAFEPLHEPLASSYLRAFRWRGDWFGLARGGDLYRSSDGLGDFEPGPNPFARRSGFRSIRHVAVHVAADSLWVYFSRVGDAPERILRTRLDLSGDWRAWAPSIAPQEVLAPEEPYEGRDLPPRVSRRGAAAQPENAVRDPAIFSDRGRTWLVYSVAGESGLAIAELTEPA